ncbi:Hypothetical protein SMAX5B_009076 [Scophthalmus maximus]|uniref:Uncharacterized protein n=1 Tax=Scophthalmus maximus TaxID=52904 RepID=A0A2U9CIG5_SCOMX|nr:Hypothetical protein SMAX5B_009076 [Scophthalmus maximus]
MPRHSVPTFDSYGVKFISASEPMSTRRARTMILVYESMLSQAFQRRLACNAGRRWFAEKAR